MILPFTMNWAIKEYKKQENGTLVPNVLKKGGVRAITELIPTDYNIY